MEGERGRKRDKVKIDGEVRKRGEGGREMESGDI